MSWVSSLFKGKSDGGAAHRAEIRGRRAQKKQDKSQARQEAKAADTLAALTTSIARPPVINFPELPEVARAPSQIDPEVASAQMRRAKRRTGGRTGSQSTGLVKRG